jgi:hypothetical protein
VTVCSFQTSSEHSTSLGRVRYQLCVCGRFRVLLDSDVLTEGPSLDERSCPKAVEHPTPTPTSQLNQPQGMTSRTSGDTLDVDVSEVREEFLHDWSG